MFSKKQLILTMLSFSLFLSLNSYATLGLCEEVSAFDIYDQPHHFALRSKKWIVINYWADWCGACVAEIPELDRFAEAIKKLPVIFFAVNFDDRAGWRQKLFAQHYNVTYPLFRSNPFESLLPRTEITSLPMTFVISPAGEVRQLVGTQRVDDLMTVMGFI